MERRIRATSPAAPLFLALVTTACGPAPIPPSPPQEVIAEVSDAEIASIRGRLTCESPATRVFCDALKAFPAAARPANRPSPVALAGASLVLPTSPGTAGEEPVMVGSFLVLSDTAARQDMIVPKTPEEKEQLKPLLAAVFQSKPLPEGNPAVVFARSRTGPLPAAPSERSLAWVRDSCSNSPPSVPCAPAVQTRGYARETDDNVIVVEWIPDALLVGVYPK